MPCGKTAHDAGERALHAGDGDNHLRPGDLLAMRQQAMDASHAGIVYALDVVSQKARRQRGLLRDADIGCSGSHDQDRAVTVRLGQISHHTRSRIAMIGIWAAEFREPRGLLLIKTRDQHALLARRAHRVDDSRNLLGCLPRSVDDLGYPGPHAALGIDLRVSQIRHRVEPRTLHQLLGRHVARSDRAGERRQFGCVHTGPPFIANTPGRSEDERRMHP